MNEEDAKKHLPESSQNRDGGGINMKEYQQYTIAELAREKKKDAQDQLSSKMPSVEEVGENIRTKKRITSYDELLKADERLETQDYKTSYSGLKITPMNNIMKILSERNKKVRYAHRNTTPRNVISINVSNDTGYS